MSVVAVHPSAELYGSDRMFLASVRALQPTSTLLPGDGPLVTALADMGVTAVQAEFPVLRRVEVRSPMKAMRFLLRLAVAVPRLAWWLRRSKADVLYVSTVIAPVWLLAGRLAGVKVVCHVHESEPAMSRLASRVLLAPVRAAHLVIANSRDAERWIQRGAGVRVGRRLAVVYNGVPKQAGGPASRTDGGPSRLVVVGRLSDRKGQDVAVEALALLRAAGHDVELSLVGDCFPGYEHVVTALRATVDRLGLAGRVHFEGFQSDPSPFVRAADVAVVPSRVEPFGLVAVEALMLGRPTVASDVGGLPEIIEDGRTGQLVPVGDPAALAGAVASLLADPQLADRLGRQGRQEAERRFSQDGYDVRLRAALSVVGVRA